MNSTNNIDQFFKDKLENRAFVLEDTFIADLETKLDQRGKVGFIWWKFLLGFILVGGLFLGGQYYLNSVNSIYINDEQSLSRVSPKSLNDNIKALNEKDASEGKKKEKINITEEKIRGDKRVQKINQNIGLNNLEEKLQSFKKEKIKTQKIENNCKDLKVLSKGEENRSKKINPEQSTAVIIDQEHKEIQSQFKKTIQDLTINEDEKYLAAKNNETVFVDDAPSSENIKIIKDSSKKKVDAEIELNTTDDNLAEMVGNEKDRLKERIVSSDSVIIQPGDTDSDQNLKRDSVEKTVMVPFTDVASEKPKDVVDYKKWSISVFAGPTMISKKISGNEEAAYYSKREEVEQGISVLNYGVEVGYFFNKSVNFSTGINAITYGEDTKYSIEEIEIKRIRVISSYDTIVTADTLTGVIDTTATPNYSDQTINDTINNEFSNKNKYRYIHIPFMIGYKIRLNKVGINVKAGVVYGRLIKSEGSYINTAGNIIESTDLKKDIFNIALSTALSYRIKKFNLFIEPRYQFNISNVFPNSTTNQKYKALGVNFGIGMEF